MKFDPKSESANLVTRVLRLPARRVGIALLGFASAALYVTAMELGALVSQVLAAFATGGVFIVGLGRFEG